MKSDRQKALFRKKIIFGLISTLMWVVTGLVFTLVALSKIGDKDPSGMPIFSDEIKSIVTSVGITAIIGVVVAIIIKDKIRTFVYMASLVLATIIYKDVGMYIVLAIWLVDEYIVHALYKNFKKKYDIRKEIDLS